MPRKMILVVITLVMEMLICLPLFANHKPKTLTGIHMLYVIGDDPLSVMLRQALQKDIAFGEKHNKHGKLEPCFSLADDADNSEAIVTLVGSTTTGGTEYSPLVGRENVSLTTATLVVKDKTGKILSERVEQATNFNPNVFTGDLYQEAGCSVIGLRKVK